MTTVSRVTRRNFSEERGGDMSYEDIQHDFAGQWVAVADDEVIAVGDDPQQVLDELGYRAITHYEMVDCSEGPEVPIL